MSRIDDLLKEEKKRIDELRAPEDMEMNLKKSLDSSSNKSRKGFKFKVAAIALVVILLGYNFDSLADLGKKFIGYEDVMNGSLKELNDQGLGQKVDETYTFKNGVKFTLDGVILDENKMTMFYSLLSPEGEIEKVLGEFMISDIRTRFNSFAGYYSEGVISDDETEIKTILSTSKSPNFFEKKVDIDISYAYPDGNIERTQVSFDFDRKEALKKSVRIEIKKNVDLAKTTLKVKDLVASPTSTVIKGEIQNVFELALSYIRNDRPKIEDINMALIVNGDEMRPLSSSMSTDLKGQYFEIWFDALPEKIDSLELKLLDVIEEVDVDETIPLERGMEKEFKVLGQKIIVEDIYEKDNSTFLILKTDEETKISAISLNLDGNYVALKQTVDMAYEEVKEGSDELFFIRTLEFEGRGEKLALKIDSMIYQNTYNEVFYKYKEKER